MKSQPIESETQVDGAFLNTLQHYNEGECLSDLSEATRKVVQAVLESGKPGSVTLKLTFKPASATGAALIIQDDIKTVLPKPEQRSAIFFADEQNNLLRDNPKQLGLNLKVVAGGVSDEPVQLKVAANQ